MNSFITYLKKRFNIIYKSVLFLSCVVFILFLFPKEAKFKYEFQKGMPWLHENYIAPFNFSILKPDKEIAKERNEITQNNKPYFRVDTAVYQQQLNKFKKQLEETKDTIKWSNVKKRSFLKRKRKNKDDILSDEAKNIWEIHFEKGKKILYTLYTKGIIQIEEPIENKPAEFDIVVVKNNIAEEKELKNVFTLKTAYEFVKQSCENKTTDEYDTDGECLLVLLDNCITHNMFYDKELTQNVLKEHMRNISISRGLVLKNEKIIDRGEVVTEDKYQKLISLKKEYERQLGGAANFYFIFLGQLILICCCVTVLLLFLYLFRKDVFGENKKLTFILLLVALTILMASFSVKFENVSIYILPFCLLPVVIRTFFDTRLALYTHIITTLIVGFLAPNSFEFVYLQMIAGMIAIYSIISMQKRSQLFISALLIFISYSVSYIGIAFIHEGELETIKWMNFAWFAISATLTLFASPLIYIFEKVFGFLSDVSLMELSDTNSPLLRELAEKAPGTFQHSIQVANLAEDAIRTIGGNPLLVRTGSLYHDIGKIDNPMYFIENQHTGINPHEKLKFEQSAKIIIKHITDGIEKAKKNKLPEQIIDFVRTHHGTTKVEYFYHFFKKENPDASIDDSMFRYPGPIPYSKETVILMMADAVEASSRSLKKPDAQAVQDLIDKIIDTQYEQKQYVNSDITFKDISIIKRIFAKKLQNIYHVRIEYPKE